MTQHDGVDGNGVFAEPERMSLGNAIAAGLAATGHPASWLAEAINLDAGQISRIINGRSKELTVARVVQIEQALQLRRGHLFRAAGLIEEDVGVIEALASDTKLDDEWKHQFTEMYERLTRQPAMASMDRKADDSTAKPTKRTRPKR